jgi:hypothetical protein
VPTPSQKKTRDPPRCWPDAACAAPSTRAPVQQGIDWRRALLDHPLVQLLLDGIGTLKVWLYGKMVLVKERVQLQPAILQLPLEGHFGLRPDQ